MLCVVDTVVPCEVDAFCMQFGASDWAEGLERAQTGSGWNRASRNRSVITRPGGARTNGSRISHQGHGERVSPSIVPIAYYDRWSRWRYVLL
jgi:hypothetical protein